MDDTKEMKITLIDKSDLEGRELPPRPTIEMVPFSGEDGLMIDNYYIKWEVNQKIDGATRHAIARIVVDWYNAGNLNDYIPHQKYSDKVIIPEHYQDIINECIKACMDLKSKHK